MHAAPHPQQPSQIDAYRGGRTGIERIGGVDPGADFAGRGDSRQERERHGGSSRALSANQLRDGTHGETALDKAVEFADSGRDERPHDARGWRQGRGDFMSES